MLYVHNSIDIYFISLLVFLIASLFTDKETKPKDNTEIKSNKNNQSDEEGSTKWSSASSNADQSYESESGSFHSDEEIVAPKHIS